MHARPPTLPHTQLEAHRHNAPGCALYPTRRRADGLATLVRRPRPLDQQGLRTHTRLFEQSAKVQVMFGAVPRAGVGPGKDARVAGRSMKPV